MNTNNLVVSSFLLGLPILYFIFVKKDQYIKVNKIVDVYFESILAIQLFISIFFWSYPIVNSTIHYIDGRMAKLCIVTFSLYTVFYKTCFLWYKIAFLFCLFVSLVFFFKGSIHSMREWCCNEHIFNHMFFHIFISLGCFFTFF